MRSLAAQIIDQRVSGIAEEQGAMFPERLRAGGEKRKQSLAFVFLVAKTMLDLDDEAVLDGIVDGGNDFGVDALYGEPLDNGEIRVFLIQAKYKRNLRGDSAFPETGIVKLIEAVSVLFDPEKNITLNPHLRERVEEIRSFVREGSIPRVVSIAANNGTRWSREAQERIDNAPKEFGRQVEWRHAGSAELLELMQAENPVSATLQLSGQAMVESFGFRRALVGRMRVAELARLADDHGDRLFEKNIRRYPGLDGNRVNEAIAATLRKEQEQSNFYFYNNGITITCSQFRHNALQDRNWQVQLTDLQIVNGGQTTRTVQEIHGRTGSGSAEILVRIYELQRGDDDFVEAITYATNSQNPVDLRDLKANDQRQKNLATSIEELGYAYRAKRENRPVSSGEFTSAVVAEAVLAVWRRRPHQARFRSREHFGALYDTIFTNDLNGAQAVAAALLLRQAENRRKRRSEDAPDFLAYGSRFVAMLMGDYLPRDMDISLGKIDHRNFPRVLELIEKNSELYMRDAEKRISEELEPLFESRERTLQRLSATFRRADLVEYLMNPGLFSGNR